MQVGQLTSVTYQSDEGVEVSVKVVVRVEIEVDPAEWAEEYGIDGGHAQVKKDIAQWVLDNTSLPCVEHTVTGRLLAS